MISKKHGETDWELQITNLSFKLMLCSAVQLLISQSLLITPAALHDERNQFHYITRSTPRYRDLSYLTRECMKYFQTTLNRAVNLTTTSLPK